MKTDLLNTDSRLFGKYFFKVFFMALFALGINVSEINAQAYHSKPTAIQNLTDEEAYVMYQLENVLEAETNEYKAAKEKQRFINTMLTALDSEMTVAQAADKYLPKYELNKMQRAVRSFDASFAGTTPNRYIRNEMLFLIAY